MSLADDQNKTEITKLVTSATCDWLEERGCRPIETEVVIDRGWIADIASAIDPTGTELQNLKLIRRKPSYSSPKEKILQWQQEKTAIDRIMTVCIEVKTSRADFLGDKKWKKALPCDLCWVATTPGMIGIHEEPSGWGILEYSEKRNYVVTRKPPTPQLTAHHQQRDVIYAIALRRDNHSRYEHLREFQRDQRQRQNEYTSITRMRTAIRAAISLLRGEHGSVSNALLIHGIKNIPPSEIEFLESLWQKANSARAEHA